MAFGRGIRIPIDVDSLGAVTGIRNVDRALDKMSKSGSKHMQLLKGAAIGAGAAITTGLAVAIGTGVRETIEWEKVAARTNNIIETTGGKAGITADHIKNLSDKIQGLTGSQDELIGAGANVLLQFDKITARGGVFDRALALATDMSVEFGTNVPTAARKLARVLQDPEKGMGVLARAVGRLSEEQQKNIDVMLKHGNVIGAQNMLMTLLETKFKGAASSEGRMTEATQKAQRAFEDFSENAVGGIVIGIEETIKWVKRNREEFQGLIDTVRSVVRTATILWGKFGDDITATFKIVGRIIGNLAKTLGGMIRIVAALLRGDWSGAWEAAKDTVRAVVDNIVTIFGRLPARLAKIVAKLATTLFGPLASALGDLAGKAGQAARNIGIAIVQGILHGFQDAWHRVTDWIGGAVHGVSGLISRLNPFHFASGGVVPGQLDSPIPIVAHSGEVILNREQQHQLGMNRIMSVLHRTGGQVGVAGSSMARGGILGPAIDFAEAQVNEPYLWGGGHQGYGDWSAWDCSGFASNVAAHIPGYTGGIRVVSGFAGGKPAGASDPVAFGLRSHLGHMGIRLMGTWYDAGSGGVQKNDSHWDQLVIPPGLENLRAGPDLARSALGDPSDGPDRGAPEHRNLTAAQAIKATMKVIKGGLGTASPSTPTSAVGESIDTRHRDDSLQDKQWRAAGEGAARASGVTNPDKIAAEGDLSVLRIRKIEIDQDVREVKNAAKRVNDTIKALRARIKALYKVLKKTHDVAKRAKIVEQINALRDKVREALDEKHGLIKQAADLQADANDIGYDIGQLSAEAAAMPDAPPVETTSAETAPTEAAGPTADQQAQIDQATERARVASRSAAISDTFIRTLFGSGSIDPASGSTVVNIQVDGNLVRQEELGRWIVGVLGGQGSIPTSAFGMGI